MFVITIKVLYLLIEVPHHQPQITDDSSTNNGVNPFPVTKLLHSLYDKRSCLSLLSDDRISFFLHFLSSHGLIISLFSCDLTNQPYNRYGPTALHVAASRGHLDMVKYLVSIGADVDNCNSDMRIIFGETPLAWAVLNNHPQVAEFLIDIAGCNMDKADNDGNTPLHKAGYKGHLDVLDLLVRKGANFWARNGRQESATDYSRKGRILLLMYTSFYTSFYTFFSTFFFHFIFHTF